MFTKKNTYIVLSLGMFVAIVCAVVVSYVIHFHDTKIAFLDVGQGDAILISQGTNQILIDGGPNEQELLNQLGQQIPFWDRNIEIVIATHPDKDHINGLIGVFDNYSVNQFWHTNATRGTSVYMALLHRANNEPGVKDLVAYRGLRAILNDHAHLDVIYPFVSDVSAQDNINDTSIAMIFFVGDEKFYFAGDLASDVEDLLPISDDITVVKAGHHGARSSTSAQFLAKSMPRDVIFSVGANNRYGHPHKDVLARVQEAGVRILRTDYNGTIVYTCDKDHCTVVTNN